MKTWNEILKDDPQHSHRYAQRWKNIAAQGNDINGEARFLDAICERSSRILDAGCGTGRVGGVLAAAGHKVTGVDIDPTLISYAQSDYPNVKWVVGDICSGEIPAGPYDLVFTAGNVFWFLPADKRVDALRNLAQVIDPTGRLVIAFGAGRGYEFPDFFADVAAAGLYPTLNLSTWQAHPFSSENSTYLVSILQNQ